jgi:hypothetical protein
MPIPYSTSLGLTNEKLDTHVFELLWANKLFEISDTFQIHL